MSSRPFRAHRARRCAAGPACVHRGAIRPGQLIVKTRRAFVHVDDVEAAVAALRSMAALVSSASRTVAVTMNFAQMTSTAARAADGYAQAVGVARKMRA